MGSGIFNKHVFGKINEDELYKRRMEGLTDPTLCHFQLLSFASLAKEQFKQDQYEIEYIRSYLNAAQELAIIGERKTSQPGAFLFYQHSYALPVLYLTRHCMELAIKRAIGRMGHHAKTSHGLTKIWSSFLSSCQDRRSENDESAIKAMGKFVSCVDKLDPTGTKLRYAMDDDSYSIDTPLWVDSKHVTILLEQFVDQLEAINASECVATSQ